MEALAEELGIAMHFSRPGLTHLLQPLGDRVFCALKAEPGAIYRGGKSQREDNRSARADFASYPTPWWELVSPLAIRCGWERHCALGG